MKNKTPSPKMPRLTDNSAGKIVNGTTLMWHRASQSCLINQFDPHGMQSFTGFLDMTCIENGINYHNSESMQVLQRLCSTLKGSYLSQIHCLIDEHFQTLLCSKFIPKLSPVKGRGANTANRGDQCAQCQVTNVSLPLLIIIWEARGNPEWHWGGS